MIDMAKLINDALDMDTSDIHLLVGHPPTLRQYGKLVFMHDYPELTPEMLEALMRSMTPERSQMELEEVQTTDFAFSFEDKCRFRVAVGYQRGTLAINMRVLPNKFLTFQQIGIPNSIIELLESPKGLFLVTGPTGSGKTTTLASLVQWINKNQERHIVTIEDPIEYYFEPAKSIFTQREVRVDVPSFAEGTVRAMRMDPDVMLVGEMRDAATITAAVTAAETGHLVFSTLHTTGADRTVERIVGIFPVEQQEQIRIQLAGTLISVISQVLLPRKDGKGRMAALEVMVATNAIRHLIRDKKEHSIVSAIQTGQALGMRSMDDSLLNLFRRGLVTKEEVLRHAVAKGEMAQRIGQIEGAPAATAAKGAASAAGK
ncbi:MAG: PilT/PilU family type 4a pilus ATPase [Armatimonadetes bacterium]|nr:PilT/PilU family type 4a pilus ATPase [Armatimonadota bacterium]NIM24912.1 PilT/PilU family type 4a pilus ATPase [Armatimonadota bacterium]NIM68805.1 PilT/PilU family type 4a pilus ATPase [Armatimonadota bacterium]NIM77055.1 PilT/PilU family type 4a pilus ATPase [Armatimonadota bacterium]NIN06234.1 PilT/PilU family type 4a pilus ATPase [Armatimonadota bacterium]